MRLTSERSSDVDTRHESVRFVEMRDGVVVEHRVVNRVIEGSIPAGASFFPRYIVRVRLRVENHVPFGRRHRDDATRGAFAHANATRVFATVVFRVASIACWLATRGTA